MVMGEISKGTEVLVIGSGPAGYVAAIRTAQLGKDVTLIEKEPVLGGICLNHGCIPSKALIHASNTFVDLNHLEQIGITIPEKKLNLTKMQKWKQGVVTKLNTGVEYLCKKNQVEIIKGEAVFENSNKVLIKMKDKQDHVEFQKCIIATGSRPRELKGFDFENKFVISSKQALGLDHLPKKLVIVGGGYIGLEMAFVYANLGSKVTILEAGSKLLTNVDEDIVRVLEKSLKDKKVEILVNAKATKLNDMGNTAQVVVETKEKGSLSIEADKVLIAIGRIPNTELLQLNKTKVELNEKGFIKVNKQMKTTDLNIFAIGDVVGQPMLAHKGSTEAKVAAEIIGGNKTVEFDHYVIPSVMFTSPEYASAGLTEQEAKKQGKEIIIGKFPFTALGKALASEHSEGFVKILAEKKTQTILGVHIIGHNASDLISEAALMIENALTLEDVALTIHPHPTMPEAIMEAAEDALGKAIHIFKPK